MYSGSRSKRESVARPKAGGAASDKAPAIMSAGDIAKNTKCIMCTAASKYKRVLPPFGRRLILISGSEQRRCASPRANLKISCKIKKKKPEKLTWLEHYPPDKGTSQGGNHQQQLGGAISLREAKAAVYNSLVLSVPLCGSESWALAQRLHD
jgi:hypothetical protein